MVAVREAPDASGTATVPPGRADHVPLNRDRLAGGRRYSQGAGAWA
ncbi:MAG: hypothetical protein BMS9Abin01_0032 [Gammaproteobacteria bacterium]|nr:MAG: hypothetical protein BMS9Abin01_0032 [Gammaproteobacteria bacterium]